MALLIWARCPTRFLPSLHFSLWPLPLSAAPCLGKMRVSSARWRVPWLPWGGGGGLLLLLCLLLDYYLSSHSSGAKIRMWDLWCGNWVQRRMNTQVLCSFLVLCLCKH